MTPQNPRWVEYARRHESPTNWGFMAWIHGMWRRWEAEQGRRPNLPHTEADQAAFDAWLTGAA